MFAVGASGLSLTLVLTPTALAAGSVRQSVGKGITRAARTYRGKTSHGKSIKITVAHRKVDGKVAWKARCNQGSTLSGTFTFRNIPVSGGKFGHKFHGRTPVSGFEDHWTASISGTVRKRKAHGTFSDKNAIFRGSSKIAQCNIGKLIWTVHRF
ncbi:MAG: hypothetical protein ACTHQQ_21810 [Solirubrobacteraceae bacterium]